MNSSEHDSLIVVGGSAGGVLVGIPSEQRHTSFTLIEARRTADRWLVSGQHGGHGGCFTVHTLIGSNTNAVPIAIAEKAVDLIRAIR